MVIIVMTLFMKLLEKKFNQYEIGEEFYEEEK